MIDYPTLHLRIQLDDLPPFDQSTTMTVITNGRCFGNGFWVCPDARVDDGFFDLMIAQAVSRLTILRMIPRLMKGTHVSEPIVRMARAQRVVIESDQPLVVETDGEIPFLGAHRLELDILPRKLRMIV
jgi:diacylglycerol kinase (ATP)